MKTWFRVSDQWNTAYVFALDKQDAIRMSGFHPDDCPIVIEITDEKTLKEMANVTQDYLTNNPDVLLDDALLASLETHFS